jgi:hypothetical protein
MTKRRARVTDQCSAQWHGRKSATLVALRMCACQRARSLIQLALSALH